MIKHFIIGGAQRCATSYLAQMLDAHPEVELAKPLRPEPKFFLRPELYSGGPETYIQRFFRTPPEPGVAVRGEKSTSYIESGDAARRIAAMLADVRLIFVLRNPVERAISNVAFSRAHGYEHAPVDEALARELESRVNVLSAEQARTSVSPQAYLARGRYVEYLRRYRELFGAGRMYIVLTETLIANLSAVQAVYGFVGADPGFIPNNLDIPVNAGEYPAEQPSAALRARLENYFSGWNTALAKEFHLDLGPWKR